ncbi:hypothetical protein CFI14_16075 [Lactiplantibacillus pentosus]|jgi:capsular polysaccharide biosynthesis protein|uniref:hypothetical protein n=1 Tax=Lactiplantibacillus pentosus TaxID=1589 RepID=UPI000EAA1BF3|nr:hypothetical protein [Lactiplantibacillus pentosus]AYG36891.1 hypothetical protein CFK27_02495 [Lactiplantibacillus pentosus]AYG42520.1 hypothetical protein CFI14_16075 [Lactiplantibacillus pentosus]MCB5222502.1 hypothetical protein [Lactiplantibacillus pentosus]MCT3290647.1 hypothetical protein [Lactiplantibacillus pentosus]
MKTIFSFLRSNRNNWEMYLFPIVICLAFSALFINNDNYVYTTEIQVKSRASQKQLKPFDTTSISVYQTILKNPDIIASAQNALADDYNIHISEKLLVKAITTTPVLSGDSLKIKATNKDPDLAVAMGKQVTKSLFYVLKSYIPAKQVNITSRTSLKNVKTVSISYAILVSVILGSAIGLSIQLLIENEIFRKHLGKRRK